ncbi:uncharacterized protein LOC143222387 [Tachypleus tridentatus]|uniref:uncharacterized protein LOC143222387 n=1 Tax=Tachypleus tridentatus TaxID=6853 RepID=UPI003FD5FCFF
MEQDAHKKQKHEELLQGIHPPDLSKQGLTDSSKSVKKPRSGDILVETSSSQHSKLLLTSKALGDIPIEVTPHSTLNTSRGVIDERDLRTVPELEILAGLTSQGVTAVRRIFTRKDRILELTNVLMLTFTVPHPPTTIKAGYLNFKVQAYIPNPVQCFHCQRYGHSKQSCHGSFTCARCGGKDHNATECQLEPHCVNCNGTHPSYFTSCPKWVEEKEVQHLKTVNNLTYTEARKLLLSILTRTCAAVTRSIIIVGVPYPIPNTIFTSKSK